MIYYSFLDLSGGQYSQANPFYELIEPSGKYLEYVEIHFNLGNPDSPCGLRIKDREKIIIPDTTGSPETWIYATEYPEVLNHFPVLGVCRLWPRQNLEQSPYLMKIEGYYEDETDCHIHVFCGIHTVRYEEHIADELKLLRGSFDELAKHLKVARSDAPRTL